MFLSWHFFTESRVVSLNESFCHDKLFVNGLKTNTTKKWCSKRCCHNIATVHTCQINERRVTNSMREVESKRKNRKGKKSKKKSKKSHVHNCELNQQMKTNSFSLFHSQLTEACHDLIAEFFEVLPLFHTHPCQHFHTLHE